MRIANLPLVAWLLTILGLGALGHTDEPRVLKGHADKVTSLALSEDGARLLSGSDDKTVRLWDVESGKELLALKGHTNFVLSVAISADGRRALSGSGGEFRNGNFTPGSDRSMRLWDLESGKELLKISHPSPVWTVRFLPDGSALSVTDSLRLWDLKSGKEIRRIGQRHSGQGVAVSADGKHVLAAAAVPDLVPRLWETASGDEVQRFEGHKAVVRGAALSPDGKYALTGGGEFRSRRPGCHAATVGDRNGTRAAANGRAQGTGMVRCVFVRWPACPVGRRRWHHSLFGRGSAKKIGQFKGHVVVENDPRVGLGPDVRAVLFTAADGQAISVGHDRTIRIWGLA